MSRIFDILKPAIVLACLSSLTLGQVAPQRTDTDDVVKITTKLVQVDVVVTDKDGKQVRDLRPEDFQLTQDGKAQKIVGFSYVPMGVDASGQPAGNSAAAATNPAPSTEPTLNASLPPTRTRMGEAARLISIVVDDGACTASAPGILLARDSLKKFIEEQMSPTDSVAIYRTRSGSSLFQQYTSDKAVLLKAVNKIKWYPSGPCGLNDGGYSEASKSNTFLKPPSDPNARGLVSVQIESEAERKIREERVTRETDRQAVGTLGVLRYALKGLAQAPGRKVMFFLSDGLALQNREGRGLDARESLRDLTDAANRAGVVINTLTLRASEVPGMVESRDEVYIEVDRDDFNATDKITGPRMKDAQRLEDGLRTIADETGGEFARRISGLDKPMGRILSRETGYYLLAYEPEDGSFKSKKFNSIEVKVARPDLKVSYRSGFIGVPDAEAKPAKQRNEDSDLFDAIAAPVIRSGLAVKLSAFYGNSLQQGNFVRAILHINGSEITFADDENGQKKAIFDVVAVTMNEKNDVVDEFNRSHTVRFDPRAADHIKRFGLIYSADVPVKKPGTYNFRVAVRDGSSRQLGSASEVIEVPDLGKSGLFVSGVTVSGLDDQGKFTLPGPSNADNAISIAMSTAVPAIRRFRPGATVAYAFSIYNAKLAGGGRPDLTVTANLYRDGKLVLEGPEQPVDLKGQADLKRITDFAYMRLDPQAEPGDYTLHIVIRDRVAGAKAVASQFVEFEVAN